VSVAPGHRLHDKEQTMSTIHSDPLFVRAEVEYRLERFGPRADRATESWPDLPRRLRHWVTRRRRGNRRRTSRPALAPTRPLHP
jgi:hypothetical protein